LGNGIGLIRCGAFVSRLGLRRHEQSSSVEIRRET
jgi:hypothetical protein